MRTRFRWALVPAALRLACGPGPGDAPRIRHGDPRPECRCEADAARVPWLLPQVVAAGWSEPVKLPTLNTPCPEDAIEISRDGATLYFYWSPTVGAGSTETLHGTTGTYYASRVGADPGSFAEPRFFDLRQDADGACDAAPSFTPAGDGFYFHSTRAANTGYRRQPPVDDPLDIYFAPVVGGVPGDVRNLGEPLNSQFPDGEHALSPDGNRLFLTSTRPGGRGEADLWVSSRSGDAWSAPENLGAPVNSTGADLQPAFDASAPADLYFASARGGATGIWRTRFNGFEWREPELVVSGYVGEPSLTADGRLLYFVHVLVDANGVFGSDIWYARRTQ